MALRRWPRTNPGRPQASKRGENARRNMAACDLTTLAAVKAWLGLPSSASPNDATLAALITAASRAIYAWLSRPALLPRAYSETLDGESQRVMLRHWPVLSVASVAV